MCPKTSLAAISGRKEWVFYDFEDIVNLYKVKSHFNVDAFRPDRVGFGIAFLPVMKVLSAHF